jgi:hypothetical protein
MAKRINMVKVPFNYYWPKVSAVTCISELGAHLVKDEIADAAIGAGYAELIEDKKTATRRPRSAKSAVNEPATDTREPAPMDGAGLSPDDSADLRAAVDDAG